MAQREGRCFWQKIKLLICGKSRERERDHACTFQIFNLIYHIKGPHAKKLCQLYSKNILKQTDKELAKW